MHVRNCRDARSRPSCHEGIARFPVDDNPIPRDLGDLSYTAAVNLRRKCPGVSGLLLGACLLSPSTFRGQPGPGLEGTVLDQTGGIIPGADVVLLSDDRVLTTKTNESGLFRFADLPPSVRYIEVSSPGFASASIPITHQTPQPLPITLWVGEYSGPAITQCAPNMLPGPLPSVSYEERSGNVQLTGIVTEVSRVPAPFTSLTLLHADLNLPPVSGQNPARTRGMKSFSNERIIAEIVSNGKGEFQFTDLEPGWYMLRAARDDSSARISFWVARENLTRLSRIYLLPKNYTGCSILRGAFSTQDSPLPQTVQPPQN